MTIDILSVRIVDLMEAGLLSPSAKLHGYHGQNRIDAEVKSDGSFVCGSIISASPSVAAGQAITATSGQRSPGRTYWSINGWQFWRVTHGGRAGRTLADLRRELFEIEGQAQAGN